MTTAVTKTFVHDTPFSLPAPIMPKNSRAVDETTLLWEADIVTFAHTTPSLLPLPTTPMYHIVLTIATSTRLATMTTFTHTTLLPHPAPRTPTERPLPVETVTSVAERETFDQVTKF